MMKPYYSHEGITIYLGDCRDVLPSLGPVDLVLTDPPYGVGLDKRSCWGSSNKGKVRNYGKQSWDAEPPDRTTIALVIGAGKHAILWGGNHFGDLPRSSCWLVWDKDNTGDFADCELAWTNLNKAVRKIRWRWNGMLQEFGGENKETRFHPAQKPVEVMKWAIGQAPICETILDPFMGSGTTLVAAKSLGRKCVGIEIVEKYAEITAKRLEQGYLAFTE